MLIIITSISPFLRAFHFLYEAGPTTSLLQRDRSSTKKTHIVAGDFRFHWRPSKLEQVMDYSVFALHSESETSYVKCSFKGVKYMCLHHSDY
jgi:hypothetical protein